MNKDKEFLKTVLSFSHMIAYCGEVSGNDESSDYLKGQTNHKINPEGSEPEEEDILGTFSGNIVIDTEIHSRNSLKQYQNSTACNLFLRELRHLDSSQTGAINVRDCFIIMDGKYNPTHESFSLEISLSKSFVDFHLKQKSQKLNKAPLSKNQAIFVTGAGGPWFGFVHKVYYKKKRSPKGITGPFKVLFLTMHSYSWSAYKLSKPATLQMEMIIPGSVASSRILNALAGISSSLVSNLLLGQFASVSCSTNSNPSFSNQRLDASQEAAVKHAMDNPLTIIEGLPGTGKACVLIELVSQLLHGNYFPILVTCESNTTADNIATQLLSINADSVLRIVPGCREAAYRDDERIGPICLHVKGYSSMPAQMRVLADRLLDPESFVNEVEYKAILNARNPIYERIVAESKVIITTTIVAGSVQLGKLPQVPVVIVAEAGQCSEFTSLIPLSLPLTSKIVLMGSEIEYVKPDTTPNLESSLFERVISGGEHVPCCYLEKQYRINPEILKLLETPSPCHVFKDSPKPYTCYEQDPSGISIVDSDTGTGSHDLSHEYDDPSEVIYALSMRQAKSVVQVLNNLIFVKNIERSRLGVITFNHDQQILITTTIAKDKILNETSESVKTYYDNDKFDWSASFAIDQISGITVSTIDAFQSKSLDFIVLACVCWCDAEDIEKPHHARQWRSAITRANKGLILVGDPKCSLEHFGKKMCSVNSSGSCD